MTLLFNEILPPLAEARQKHGSYEIYKIDEEPYDINLKSPKQLAQESDLVLRDHAEFACGLIVGAPNFERLVGVLWTWVEGFDFHFSIAVDQDCVGMGYEEHLIIEALKRFEEYDDELSFCLDKREKWSLHILKALHMGVREDRGTCLVLEPRDTSQIKEAGTQVQKTIGGTTIFGLKKIVADRIDRKLRLYELEPFSSTISFKNAREVRFLLGTTFKNEQELSDFAVDYIARDIAQDLKRSLGYRIEGSGLFVEFNKSAQIILTQRLV